ncbi:hypothetical protein AB0442_39895 [Kitasatospora sp. NPDC085895]|uniref:hypothetical protein n=1 Tax=Kitasatospora sp. NPDC085895 TaxID=3155057 RepID=UPI003450CB2C
MSKSRVRTRHTNGRPALKLSKLPSTHFNVRSGEQFTIICPDCRRWRRVMGSTTLKIKEHPEHRDEENSPLCPGSRQLVVIDINVAAWQAEQNRLVRDAVPAETRRAARQHYKPLPEPAPAVHHMAERRETVPAPTTAERADQWRRRLPAVFVTDTLRRIPLRDAVGPIRGIEVPTEKPSRAA